MSETPDSQDFIEDDDIEITDQDRLASFLMDLSEKLFESVVNKEYDLALKCCQLISGGVDELKEDIEAIQSEQNSEGE